MVPIMSLWVPILLAAVLVFVASSIIHMVLPYHRTDYRKVPSEDEVMDAVRKFGIPPGDYMMPCAVSPKERIAPAFVDKMKKGPVAVMTVMPAGPPAMGKSLAQWFIYCIVVGIFAAYITGRALPPGAQYLTVFQLAGCSAFMGYALALWPISIWLRRAWGTTLKSTVDGFVYGLLTAGAFGWLWPA